MKRLLILVVLVFPLSNVLADPGQQQLEGFLHDLHTLQADFQQTLQQPDDAGVHHSSGTFYLKRPGKLRWEYDPPNQQIIVADGKRIWLHDIELDQVSHRSQRAALAGTPAQLLSDTGEISAHFEILELGEQAGMSWLELRPKGDDSQFNSLRLALQDKQLKQMVMSDNFGQTTRFVFSHMRRNPSLDPELFIFHAPPSIDIIGDL